MKKSSLLALPTVLLSLAGPVLTTVNADVNTPSTTHVSTTKHTSDVQTISDLNIISRSAFTGVLDVDGTPASATFDDSTNTIKYDDSVIRFALDVILTDFDRLELIGHDKDGNETVLTTGRATNVTTNDYEVMYVALEFEYQLSSSEKAKYAYYTAEADYKMDYNGPQLHAVTTFSLS